VETFEPTEKISGLTYQEWIVKWWNQEQDSKDVFLLLPDFDGELESTIDINSDQAVLISPINYISVNEDGKATKGEMKKETLFEIDIINKDKISLKLDGEELGPLCTRVATDFFDTVNGPAISDGYWVFLKRLEKGEHELTSFGTCRSGKIKLSRKTTLKVN